MRVYIADMPSRGPRWHLDALLAERVFAPILHTWGGALAPWRFHRRAADDAEGHRFSFAFRADPAVARQVLAAVRASALLDALRRAGDVRDVREETVPREGPASGELAAGTDPAWPPAVQQAWPYFAMGASRNWLALVEQVSAARAGGAPPADDDLAALIAHYRGVNEDVSALWRDNAQHAWLHHLNALFGYQPVLIRELRLMQF